VQQPLQTHFLDPRSEINLHEHLDAIRAVCLLGQLHYLSRNQEHLAPSDPDWDCDWDLDCQRQDECLHLGSFPKTCVHQSHGTRQ
jgi:hypothetical protein